jgi:hypothetical protein
MRQKTADSSKGYPAADEWRGGAWMEYTFGLGAAGYPLGD